MGQHPIQQELLDLFGQTRDVLETFIASRSAADRAQVGTEQQWSGKDVLSHVACWMEYMVQRMGYFARGEPAPRTVDFDAVSLQAFRAYQHQPWDVAVAYLYQSWDALVGAVQRFTEAQLTATNSYSNGTEGPLWQEIRANGFIVPLQEVTKFYALRGEHEQAAQVSARLYAALGEPPPLVTDLIDPQALAVQRQGDLAPLVIDVRGADEYAVGHVQGAINIPLADLAAHLDQLPADRPVVTYCNMYHKGTSRGERAAALLTEQGYQAAALDGGFPAWRDTGLPVESA
jgi:rhodanese-related sulfurtransferase